MNIKKHLMIVFALTSALLLGAVAIYLSGCKPTFLLGLCSAVRLTRVAYLVLTTLNFLLISSIAFSLKLKYMKKSDKNSAYLTYLLILIVSFALALIELKVMTQVRFTPKLEEFSNIFRSVGLS